MVNNGQPIRTLRYAPKADSTTGLDLLSFGQVRLMPVAGRAVVRGDFHVLARCTAGTGSVTVDFVTHPVTAGTITWIRPGWTHRWDDIADLRGYLLLCPSELLPAATLGHLPSPATPPNLRATPLTDAAFDHLTTEYAATPPDPAILRHLLSALTLRLAAALPVLPDSTDLFTRFAHLTERYHSETREVSWYASQLGYSPRTLSRAVQSATGSTAKQYLNSRVILEAKRLLAHEPVTTAECARRLGFDDPANFTKFFRTHAATTPTDFRLSLSGSVRSSLPEHVPSHE
ncbi:helix-turn-helix domain-containing protein [Nocardia sp. ET3-3]|uniref:Helix-turn-helix domain-containing protein n=1 Tax=Nocardia terrae TaxID=2675851 RepID=A0A7K1V5U1_9NOCA|nr:helix-turn-helix transcriptional regulator [Nocardia terrae]MVU81468.1 helix-turn-helix domain-containing protein [Nocardia terrae]